MNMHQLTQIGHEVGKSLGFNGVMVVEKGDSIAMIWADAEELNGLNTGFPYRTMTDNQVKTIRNMKTIILSAESRDWTDVQAKDALTQVLLEVDENPRVVSVGVGNLIERSDSARR